MKENLFCFGYTDRFPSVMFALAVSLASAGSNEREGRQGCCSKHRAPKRCYSCCYLHKGSKPPPEPFSSSLELFEGNCMRPS